MCLGFFCNIIAPSLPVSCGVLFSLSKKSYFVMLYYASYDGNIKDRGLTDQNGYAVDNCTLILTISRRFY